MLSTFPFDSSLPLLHTGWWSMDCTREPFLEKLHQKLNMEHFLSDWTRNILNNILTIWVDKKFNTFEYFILVKFSPLTNKITLTYLHLLIVIFFIFWCHFWCRYFLSSLKKSNQEVKVWPAALILSLSLSFLILCSSFLIQFLVYFHFHNQVFSHQWKSESYK